MHKGGRAGYTTCFFFFLSFFLNEPELLEGYVKGKRKMLASPEGHRCTVSAGLCTAEERHE